MNTAPLQLLPVNYGDDQQKKVSQQVKPEESGRRFDDVLEKAVNSSEKPPVSSSESRDEKSFSETSHQRAEDGAASPKAAETEDGRSKDSGRTRVEAEAGKKSKTARDTGGKSEDVAKKAKVADDKTEEDLAAVFAGLSGGEKNAQLRGMKSGKQLVNSEPEAKLLKLDPSEILKSQAAAFKIVGSGFEEKSSGGGKKGLRLSGAGGKLSSEASQVLHKAAAAAKDVKVRPMAAGGAGGNAAEDKVTAFNSKDKRASSKLRVVNHSANSGRQAEGRTFQPASEDSLRAPAAASDDTGKIIELNAAPDSARTEARSSDFRMQQSAVLSQLKDEVNSQIVKQAGIVVKANGNGEIKLVMRPEQLGKVRIQLSLNDNHIAGRIIVENNIVREIFESNLENLYKAFGSEGFENGGLEVMVEGGDAGESGRRSSGGLNRRAVKAIEDAVPELADSEWQNNAVNMVV